MNKRSISLVFLIIVVLLLAAGPALGAPKHGTQVSGLECVYVQTPGQMEITDSLVLIKGQVNQNRFFSDDPAVFPNGINTAVIDAQVNLHSGMVLWSTQSAVFQPDGFDDTFVAAAGGGWFKPGGSKGQAVFHGTGEFQGLTLKQELYPGDISQCPPAANLFDATGWTGFIAPARP